MTFDNSRLYLTGMKEARNATQFAFTREETAALKTIFEGESIDAAKLDELFLNIGESLVKYSPRLARALKFDEWKDAFSSLTENDKRNLIKTLIAIGNGKSNVADLTVVGGAKFSGSLLFTYSNLLTKGEGITFIDQSVTGMFEKRTHIGL